MRCTLKDKFKLFINHNLQVSSNRAKAMILCYYKSGVNFWRCIMTKEEFLSALAKNNIDVKVHFDDSAMSEGFCVRKNHFRYETLYCERGKEYDVIGHPSESDALIFLWNRINKNIK